MLENVPAVLVVLTCTALYHALKEWERNGGAPPVHKQDASDAGEKKRAGEWEYFFNRLNDGGEFSHC
jgi:hypothetical protein